MLTKLANTAILNLTPILCIGSGAIAPASKLPAAAPGEIF